MVDSLNVRVLVVGRLRGTPALSTVAGWPAA